MILIIVIFNLCDEWERIKMILINLYKNNKNRKNQKLPQKIMINFWKEFDIVWLVNLNVLLIEIILKLL